MNPSVSIVLTAYKRYKQLEKTLESILVQKYSPLEIIVVEDGDDGQTQWVAKRSGARYINKKRTDLPYFQNPSRTHNIGIRAAQNDIIILQGAEVKYTGPLDIVNLVAPIVDDPITITTACVQSLKENGEFDEWYVHPSEGRRVGWIVNFCLAMRRERILKIQGFEESFIGYGQDDDYLMFCLRKGGARFEYVKSVVVQHQWHDRSLYDLGIAEDYDAGHQRLKRLLFEVEQGKRPPIANFNKDWGIL